MRLERDLTCGELVELVTEYLDGALATDDAERFEEHLTLCPACVAHFEQMRATIDVTGTLHGRTWPRGSPSRCWPPSGAGARERMRALKALRAGRSPDGGDRVRGHVLEDQPRSRKPTAA